MAATTDLFQTVVSIENPPNLETFIEESEPPIMCDAAREPFGGDRRAAAETPFDYNDYSWSNFLSLRRQYPHLIPAWPPPKIGQRDALILCIGGLHCSSVKPRSTTSGSQTCFRPLNRRLRSPAKNLFEFSIYCRELHNHFRQHVLLFRHCRLDRIRPLALSCRSVTRAIFLTVGFPVSRAREVNTVLLVSSTIFFPSFVLDFNSYGKSKVRMVEPKFKMTLAELLDECKVVSIFVCGNLEVEIIGIQHDSRFISLGDLFVCCVGMKTNGQLYLSEVDKRGAVAVVASKEIDIDETLGCKALVILEGVIILSNCWILQSRIQQSLFNLAAYQYIGRCAWLREIARGSSNWRR
ncbi:hypothetical protein NE237_013806 [Protea cynaroides]|uniref:Uncharacterized protein n=1 Tax=Protea cynaroides TaxID=273540 RepID=A0A9Q0H2E5_9MAGN|nr:hypothetical protein NE237_013806 [Protea cynaroides]